MRDLKTAVLGAAILASMGVHAACGGGESETGATAPSSGGAAGSGGGSAGTGGAPAGAPGLALPQFTRGAAMVNPEAFAEIFVRVVPSRAVDAVVVTLDGAPLAVTRDAESWAARVDAASLADGAHALRVTAEGATVDAALHAVRGSAQLTKYSDVGFAISTTLLDDRAADRMLLGYVHKKSDDRHAFLAQLDGAGRRVVPDDLVLDTPDAPADRLDVAVGGGMVAALTQVKKTIGQTPTAGVRARVLTLDGGEERLAPVDLLGQNAGIPGGQSAIAWDGAQFVAVWQELELPAVEKKIKLARLNPATGKAGEKVTVAVADSKANEDGKIDDQQRLSIACNPKTCVIGFSKRKYHSLVQLSSQKTHLVTVDLATMTVGPAVVALGGDWDIQEDTSLVAQADGTFALGFVGTNTELALDGKDAQRVYFATLGADGALQGKPVAVNGDEGQRYNSGLGAHPDGAAIFWEDQREKETDLLMGQNRLALNFVKAGALERAYFFLPRTRIVVEPWAAATPAGPNYRLAWIDERAGGTVLDPRGEVFFDTYWRR